MRLTLKLVLSIVMNVLLLVAGLLVARIIIGFFGSVGAIPVAKQFMGLTGPYVPSFGFGTIATPYRGVFDIDAGLSLGVVLVAEWVATFVRRLV